LKKGSIQSVTFDSVSLTAAIPLHAQPNPLTQAGIAQNALNVAGAPAVVPVAANNLAGFGFPPGAPNMQIHPLPAPVLVPAPAILQNMEPDWLAVPRLGSWVDIIDGLNLDRTLAHIRYERNTGPEPQVCTSTHLRKLEFTSCGYVRLPMDFDQSMLEGIIGHNLQHANLTKRINDIDPHMMKSLDNYLGVIINYIPAVEVAALENAWNFDMGWRVSQPELFADAVLDGNNNPGGGRFNGLIEVIPPVRGSSCRF